MFPHLYRTYINARGEGNLLELVIDLGFHALVKEPVDTARREPYYRAPLPKPPEIQLLLGEPGESRIAPWCQGPPELTRA